MLVLNPMTADSRVDKEASALGAAGHDVTVVATAAAGLPGVEQRGGYRVLRLPYRRTVKDRVVGRSRALAAEAAARRSLLGAARAHGASGPAWDAAHARHAAGALGLRAAGAAVRLGGGAVLKTARTGLLPVEYWHGTASALPRRVARPDVVHAHDLGTLAAAVRLARRWHRRHPGRPRPRVVYDSHELYVEQQTSWTRRERLAWRAHEARWIGAADLVVTVSDGIADELARRYRLRARPLVLFNSPDVERAGAAPRALRDDVGADGTPLVAYAGTVKAGRGVGLVVDAMAHSPAWHLALVGPGSSTGDVLDRAPPRASPAGSTSCPPCPPRSCPATCAAPTSACTCWSPPAATTSWRCRTSCSTTSPPACRSWSAACRRWRASSSATASAWSPPAWTRPPWARPSTPPCAAAPSWPPARP